MTDTTIKASFSRFGELKTLLRHTFKFKGKEYLNGNISLYFTKLTHQLPDRMNQNPTGKHETIFKIQFNPKINEELPELESSDKEEEENMEEVEKEPTEEPPTSETTTAQQQSSKPSTKSQKSKSPKTKSNTPTSVSTIRDFYQKNFVFTNTANPVESISSLLFYVVPKS